jgi:hypothetical protein
VSRSVITVQREFCARFRTAGSTCTTSISKLCRCWRCMFYPCKVRNRFLVKFWNRTILLWIPCIQAIPKIQCFKHHATWQAYLTSKGLPADSDMYLNANPWCRNKKCFGCLMWQQY